MTDVAAQRPVFFEGQYLGADDLIALITYLRGQDARHSLGLHSWGIAIGLDLVETTTPDGEIETVITPGFAVDGYGRQIVVTEPHPLSAALFEGRDPGEVPVWIRYEATEGQGVRRGFEVCTTDDTFRRLHESFAIELGPRDRFVDQQSGVEVNNETLVDPRLALRSVEADAAMICDAAVPHQAYPDDEDEARWLLPLGFVRWQPATGDFAALTADQRIRSRIMRRTAGNVVESILAADGIIRLRDRERAYDGVASPGAVCREDLIQAGDLRVCDGNLRFDDLIWMEGNTRLTADTRIWGGLLEFRNEQGDDYLDRVVAGVPRDAIAPLMLERLHVNEIEGSDLQVLLGKDDDRPGKNRLVISETEVAVDPADECGKLYTNKPRIAIQSNGRFGIGTFAPTTELNSPLTIRGVTDQGEILSLEDTAGTHQWRINLGEGQGNINFIETAPAGDIEGRLFLEAGGNIGISMTDPEAKLDITDVQTTSSGSGLGNDLWFRVGNGDDSGRVWIEYGSQAAPLLVLSDEDDPPRIQFQQGTELAPDHVSWIGHGDGNSPDISIMGANVGIGTETPVSMLHMKGGDPDIFLDIDGSSAANWTELRMGMNGSQQASIRWDKNDFKTYIVNQGTNTMVLDRDNVGMGTSSPATTLHIAEGSDVTTNGGSGFLLLGSPSDLNIGFDNNEIQARDGNAVSTLFLQHEGGALRIGNTKLTVQSNGDVGINTNAPSCRLHVRDSLSGNANQIENHVACIDNTSTDNNADVLALRVAGTNPGDAQNFITFFDGSGAIASFEGNGGSVAFNGTGADFAECLPMVDHAESIAPGDVVGVHDGHITKRTTGADKVLVVTDRAIVVGNRPGDESAFQRVALMGQVGVKIRGPVSAGDVILATGDDDGIAMAVPAEQVPFHRLGDIVGQAWQTDFASEIRRVNVAISFLSGLVSSSMSRRIEEQADRIAALEERMSSR